MDSKEFQETYKYTRDDELRRMLEHADCMITLADSPKSQAIIEEHVGMIVGELKRRGAFL